MDKGKKIKKPSLYTVLMITFIIGAAVCIALIIKNIIIEEKQDDLYEQLRDEVIMDPAEDVLQAEEPAAQNVITPVPDAGDIQTDIQPDIQPDPASSVQNEDNEPDNAQEPVVTEAPEPTPTKEPEPVQSESAPVFSSRDTLDQSHSRLDWDKLKAYNSDIYAWVYIPNTKVDYPVLQSATDNQYYLDYNIDGSKGYPGCIFSENYNSRDFSDKCTLLYGHNMKKGTMFRTLHYFEDIDFFENNRYVYIYQPDQTLVYEVYGCCVFNMNHILFTYNWDTMNGIKRFIKDIDACRGMTDHVRSDMSVAPEDQLLVLSTCIDTDDNKRFIVVCVKK